MTTTKLMMIGLSLLTLTACETGKSGAEISDLGESLVSTNGATTDESPTSAGPAIDYNARSAANYANAQATCQSEGRALCTKAQLAAADSKGNLDYYSGYPRNYWMATEYTQGVGNTNAAYYIASYGASYQVSSTTSNRAYYCCL